jgi:hypothetical protein
LGNVVFWHPKFSVDDKFLKENSRHSQIAFRGLFRVLASSSKHPEVIVCCRVQYTRKGEAGGTRRLYRHPSAQRSALHRSNSMRRNAR